MNTDTTRRTLYPEILEPNDCGMLKVSPIHTIYWEECGNPKGKPVLFLHGGPGGGLKAIYRRYFDPEHYRIILFDQRGCGKSAPHACLEENTTWNLISDIDILRKVLGIKKWMVFGGSWGATLALAYSTRHPSCVTSLVIRGVFLGRGSEIQWIYQDGASNIWPEAWGRFLSFVPNGERGDIIQSYYRYLTCSSKKVRYETALRWGEWDDSISKLIPTPEKETDPLKIAVEAEIVYARARIECHYFVNACFLLDELLWDIGNIRHIPAVIVQGRYDTVCPMRSAWDLHRAWPEADFRIVPDAGHSCTEPGIIHELVSATDRFRTR